MKKSAQEIISELEMRVARLEKEAASINFDVLQRHVEKESHDGSNIGFIEFDSRNRQVTFSNGDSKTITLPADKVLLHLLSQRMGHPVYDPEGIELI